MISRLPLRLVDFVSIVATVAIAFAASQSRSAETKPNFIVIFCDNLGYGDIEPFGSTAHRTPCLNRMAAEGRKFTHFCVTAGVCTPSRASLMTGCYSQRVHMHLNDRDYHVLRPVSPYGLHPDEITVAEALKQAGYATGMIGKWHLGDQTPFLPTRQGFDWFFGVPYSDDMTERVWNQDGSHWPPLPLMENETVLEAPVDRDGLTKRYTEKATEWIEKQKDGPFFLYFPQAMPGSTPTPFASPAFKGKSRNGPWGDSIEELDWSTGQLMDKLVELGIAENTCVIWTSDNGAPSLPGDISRGTNRPLNGRGYTTSEGAFRVPTLVWWPGTVPAGTVCDELSTTMDLLPTFAKLAGVEPPAARKIDGHDIRPLLLGEAGAKTPYDAFYYYYLDQLQAVRSGPWKLFLPLKDFAQHPRFKRNEKDTPALLFNVIEDIGTEHDVAAEHPEIVAELTRLADRMRADLGDRDAPGPGIRPIGKVDSPVPVVLKP
ncbi:MAG: sulfatase [Verrucomicrobiae bacterium]|nr:sulfatase [Verrucomicrobiae bacterium]MCP5539922.1 sulfatase [Akkermansiaceae bacterium]